MASIKRATATVLSVEDEAINYLYIEQVLGQENIRLLHAKNGNEAMVLFNDHPEIDLVLMDIKIPGPDGFQITKKIREKKEGIPVVAVTAYALKEEVSKGMKFGFSDYLTKPYSKNELLKIVHKHLPPK